MKNKNYSIILLSSVLLIANSNISIYANEQKEIVDILNIETNKEKSVEIQIEDNKKYVELNSILEISNIKYNANEKDIEFELHESKYIIEEGKSTFKVIKENKEIIYPISIEKIHLLKEFYVSSNNQSVLKVKDKFYVPIEFLSNKFSLNMEVNETKNNIELKNKKEVTYNYNYINSFDDVNFDDIQVDRTAKYSVYDEKYNELPVGTEVKPSPVTGFSVVKPKHGFGSDTWDYIPSKGNAKDDNWKAGKIVSPFTKDKEKQKEIFQLELGLIKGEYIQIDELGSALYLDFTTNENGVVISFMNFEISKDFNESYRVSVILSEILQYYINDKELVDKIIQEYSYYENNEKSTNEIKINEKISVIQRSEMIDIQINY